jgi:hypothetical protein
MKRFASEDGEIALSTFNRREGQAAEKAQTYSYAQVSANKVNKRFQKAEDSNLVTRVVIGLSPHAARVSRPPQ